MNLLYLTGVPGSGKSTLAALLTAALDPYAATDPFAHIVWPGDPSVVELGARRDAFSGTDALSLSVQPKALAWLSEMRPPLVLGEGDRLANVSFLEGAARAGYAVHVAYLAVSADVAEHRRGVRASALDTPPQNAAWAKGRATKVRRLREAAPGFATVTVLDADQPPASVLDQLAATRDPVAAALLTSPG